MQCAGADGKVKSFDLITHSYLATDEGLMSLLISWHFTKSHGGKRHGSVYSNRYGDAAVVRSSSAAETANYDDAIKL